MLVTEEEAGEMICPVVDNMRLKGHECLASKCMAWRWVKDSQYAIDKERSLLPTLIAHKKAPREQWKGYCGLAGKPEE